MPDLWQFLSGDVPGGLALLLVAVIAFLAIWIFVYRSGETLKSQSFRRWLWRVPLLFLLIYFVAWIQSPPKRPPLRLAVVAGKTVSGQEWACEGVADLTARRLRRALNGIIVNPWEGAKDYAAPDPVVLEKAGYHVFQIRCESPPGSKALQYSISSPSGAERTFAATEHALVELSAQMFNWVLSQLGKKAAITPAFYRNVSAETLEEYYHGRQVFREGRMDSALVAFDALWRSDSAFWPASLYRGRAHEAKGERDPALAAYIQAAQTDTGSFEAMLALGEYYLRIFEWETAEAALKIVIAREPTSARAAVGLASIHPERLKDLRLNSPEKLLKEALRLDPACERARLALADQLSDRGFPESAKKLLLEGLNLDPGSIDLKLKLGAIEIQLGQPEAARALYETILTKEPLNAIALFNLGVVDYRTRRYDRAIERFEAVQGLKGPVDCYYYLGLIYQSKGDLARAKFYFQKRWDLRTSDEDAFAIKARETAAKLEDGKSE